MTKLIKPRKTANITLACYSFGQITNKKKKQLNLIHHLKIASKSDQTTGNDLFTPA
jgi:hypothetical protein